MGGCNQADSYHQQFSFDPANVDLPVMFFYDRNPHYSYYWVIEYDVRFTGNWSDFFSCFEANDSDLLGTTLTRRADIPNWFHWPSLDLVRAGINSNDHLRGFFPIYRLSGNALRQLDRYYRDGAKGHFECLIPTLLSHAGMKIEDIGGNGEFVQPGNGNRFYRNTPQYGTLSPGTVVYRPVMHRPGREHNMLWHPVKDMSWREIGLLYMARFVRGALFRARHNWAAMRLKATGMRSGNPAN